MTHAMTHHYFLAIFSEVEKKFDTMCFNLRALADEKKAKMGINECVNHGLITPFPVLVSIRLYDSYDS